MMVKNSQKGFNASVIFVILITLAFVLCTVLPVAAADKPAKLKFAYWMSTKHSLHPVFEKYANEVKALTNGRVDITLYPGGALGGPREQWDMAVGGIADISFFMPGYTAGRFPLTSVFDLPLLLGGTSTVNTAIAQPVFEKYLEQEYKDAKILFFFVSEPFTFHTSKKQINSMADVKGLKFRSSGAVQSAMVKGLGGSPVTLPITEVYTSLEKGVIDGVVTAFTAMVGYRLWDVVKYSINANLTATPMVVAMNKKTWESLPADVQQILDNLKMRYAFECATKYDGDVGKSLAVGKSKGNVIYSLPAAELAKWEAKFTPVYDQWLEDMKAKGLPGKAAVDQIRQLQGK
jgi:TRAP-type C4-dicarboxylate transport system substrate-binding protein